VRSSLSVLLALAAAGVGHAHIPGLETRQADLIGPAGEPIGTVVVRGSANATLIRIMVRPGGLAPGWHGVRLHAVGDCSDPGSFQRARGPLDHLVKSHGLLHPEGPEESNLPNIFVNLDGSAHAEVSSLAVRMLGATGIVEGDGTALIIHAGEDDHATQPNGGAGHRVACAALR
jgi:Cu-Zn family superoxide dismutase